MTNINSKGENAVTTRNTISTLKFIVDAVKARADKGMTLTQIAEDMGMPYITAYQIARHNKIEVVDARGKSVESDKVVLRNRAISTLYFNGFTAKDIARVIGMSTQRVYQIARESGVKHPGKGPQTSHVPAIETTNGLDIKDTVRETAIANRGKASASKIAEACGVSRNSIIGHWGRALRSGELQAAE